jgi:hypothetical protein
MIAQANVLNEPKPASGPPSGGAQQTHACHSTLHPMPPRKPKRIAPAIGASC